MDLESLYTCWKELLHHRNKLNRFLISVMCVCDHLDEVVFEFDSSSHYKMTASLDMDAERCFWSFAPLFCCKLQLDFCFI